jgi:hypothetical protein
MLVIILINVVMFNLWGSGHVAGSEGLSQATQHVGPPAWPGEVAEELHRQGIRPGDKVAVIGYGFDSYWARLARVQIAAEMFDSEADPFWLGDSSVKSGVLHAFASSGAKAIVAERVPPYVNPTGWHRVGRSNYYIYVFV